MCLNFLREKDGRGDSRNQRFGNYLARTVPCKKRQFGRLYGFQPESKGQNLALTVLHGTMRRATQRCGAGAGCLVMKYQSLNPNPDGARCCCSCRGSDERGGRDQRGGRGRALDGCGRRERSQARSLPTYLPSHLPTYLLCHLPTHLPTYSPNHLHTCTPTHLPTFSPTYLPTCLPTQLSTFLSTHLPTYPSLDRCRANGEQLDPFKQFYQKDKASTVLYVLHSLGGGVWQNRHIWGMLLHG